MPRTSLKQSSIKATDRGGEMALALFHQMARRVPAYVDFLRHEKINPTKIRTLADYELVTPVHKDNYLRRYPLAELCWDGNLFTNRLISVSSGSSGQPFFWPRGEEQDREATGLYEDIYRHIFQVHEHSTLFIICFSMGTWIAGSYTTAGTLAVAQKGYPINVVTPGIELEEALKAIKALAGSYEQLVLVGYPPFVKDIIDQGEHVGIDWRQHRVRYLFAGEAFSEQWRDYMVAKAGIDDTLHASSNIFGSADAGILGYETPLSVAVRRLYDQNPALLQDTFKVQILPSLVQYVPEQRYFESVGGELVFSARAGIPLSRYNIHDTGGVLTYQQATEPLAAELTAELARSRVKTAHWQRPFVYLNGRRDFTATIYAVNIYPENIKAALELPEMRDWVTGKFTMATKNYSDMDQYFEINIELAHKQEPDPKKQRLATRTIVDKLALLNGEYHKLHAAIGAKAVPVVNLIPQGDKTYFARGVKHRWIKSA